MRILRPLVFLLATFAATAFADDAPDHCARAMPREAADLAQQFLGRPGRHAGARHPDHRPQGIAQAFRTLVRSTMDRGHQISRVQQAGRREQIEQQRETAW